MPPKKRVNKKGKDEQIESPAKKSKQSPADQEAAAAAAKHELQKQLSSALKYVGKNDSPEVAAAKQEAIHFTLMFVIRSVADHVEALEIYKSANPEVKHECLQKFAQDKSLKWISTWLRDVRESRTVTNTGIEDWMTEWEA